MVVNIKKLLKSGFFAVAASLCGLLMGSAGCSAPGILFEASKEAGASVIGQIQNLAPGKSSRPIQKKIPRGLLKAYPRSIHPQFLARLNENRQVLASSADINTSIPISSLNQDDDWETALYYAIKPASQDYNYPPPVSEITGSNFGALTYKVDTATGTTEILPAAFEDEPYTGQVIINNENGTRQLIAFIDNGRLAESGTLWDLNGTQMLAQNHYDELGFVAKAMLWDAEGTLMAQSPPADGKKVLMKGEILVARSEVRGEFIYERADDAKIESLNAQIEAATDPTERTRLEGELLNLQLTAGTPFTGSVVEFWDEKRTQKKREEPVQVGKHNGTVTWWYANGQKQFEAEYLKGVPQGRTAWSREDGSLEYEGFWENDKLLRATTWNANTQKTGEVTAGNGTLIYFHSNGQKRLEETFVNGDLSAVKWWDAEGNEVESAPPSFIPAPPKLD